MWHGVSKYRWRAHEKAAYNKKSADKKRQEAAEDAHQNKVIIALERIGQEINRAADKAKPKHKREWPWKLAEVLGLWLAALVGLCAIIIGNNDASQQRVVMQGQLDAMKADQRPWVSLASVDGIAISEPLTFSADRSAKMRLVYRLRNGGKSPALHVRFNAKIVMLPHIDSYTTEIATAQADFCDPMRSVANEFDDDVIFPGDQPSRDYPLSLSAGDVEIALKRKETGFFAHKGYVSLSVIACIDYQRPAGRSDHIQTRYAYMLGVPMEGGVIMGDIVPTGIRPDVRLVGFSQSAE